MLELIDLMVGSEELNHLLLIGAYGDNEVSPADPLMMTLDVFSEKKYNYHNIALTPLKPNSVSQMVADSMLSPVTNIQPLADVVFSKTRGNLFFVNQFLTTLHQKKIIHFDGDEKSWTWETSKIETLDVTDSIVDLFR